MVENDDKEDHQGIREVCVCLFSSPPAVGTAIRLRLATETN